MFTIKNLVSKITDKGNGQRTGESSASFVDSEDQHSAEGFLCPPCMRAFPSAEALEEHYLKAHPMGGENPSNDSDDIQFLRQEIENLQTSLVEEKSMSEELKKEVMKIQTEFYKKDDNGSSSNAQDVLEQNNALLKSEINLLRQQLTDELEQTSQLRKDKELLKEKLLSVADESDAMKLENKSLQAQLNHRNSIDDAAVLRQELVSVQRMMNQATLEKEKQIDEMNLNLRTLENSFEDARRDNEGYIARIEELQKIKDQYALLQKELAESLENQYKKDSEIEHLKGVLQTKETFESLQAEALLSQKADNVVDSSKAEDSGDGQQDPEDLKRELEALQSQNMEMSKAVQNLKLEVESHKAYTKQQTEEHSLNKRNLNAQLVDLQQTTKERLRKKDEEVSQLIKTAQDNEKAQVQKINELISEVNSLKNDVTEKNKLLEKLEGTMSAEKSKFVQETEGLKSTIETLRATTETLRATISNLETELKTSQTACEKLSQESKGRAEEIIKLTTDLKEAHSVIQINSDKLSTLESELKSLKEMLSKREENLKDVLANSSAKINQITQDYESRLSSSDAIVVEGKSKIETLTSNVKEQSQKIENLKKSLAENISLVSEKTSKITSLENEVNEMEFSVIDLKEKLKSSEEEKALLSERCLAEQSKAESSHQAYEECRRKLEDSVAALQELGRENQSLQIDSAKLHNRQWMDDSFVTNCKQCVKEFSLTIRKHHCRQCGQVFCNECSSRTASLPSSKKPVRVCDACYEDLTSK